MSDRITVIATGTNTKLGYAAEVFIERVEHKIESDRTHTVTYYVSDAKQLSDGWVLDISALGTNTRLGY